MSHPSPPADRGPRAVGTPERATASPERATATPERGEARSRPRRLASDGLLAGATEIEIEHGDAIYRLRLTSLGKLILTK